MRAKFTHDATDPAAYDAQRGGRFEDRRVNLIGGAVASANARRVLELGAGTGRIAWRLACAHPAAEITAVEPYEPMRAYGNTHLVAPNLARADEIPADHATDLAFSIDVIHHLDDRPSTFAAMQTALAPRATWVVIEPNIWHPAIYWSQERMRRAGTGEDHFRPWAGEPEFRAAGFEITGRRYMHLWPAAFKQLLRLLESAELALEWLPFFGGSVVYQLRSI